jgi:hypothetical protein
MNEWVTMNGYGLWFLGPEDGGWWMTAWRMMYARCFLRSNFSFFLLHTDISPNPPTHKTKTGHDLAPTLDLYCIITECRRPPMVCT